MLHVMVICVYVRMLMLMYIHIHVSVYASCVYMHSHTYVQYVIDFIVLTHTNLYSFNVYTVRMYIRT